MSRDGMRFMRQCYDHRKVFFQADRLKTILCSFQGSFTFLLVTVDGFKAVTIKPAFETVV